LAKVVDRLERKKVSLKIMNLMLDTATPTGKLMINLLGSIAAFEREIMLERQRDGIAAALQSFSPPGGNFRIFV
jgi:DNA invertase Pin-like site-specific DNA recombinase